MYYFRKDFVTLEIVLQKKGEHCQNWNIVMFIGNWNKIRSENLSSVFQKIEKTFSIARFFAFKHWIKEYKVWKNNLPKNMVNPKL